jgi:hypothetical protein
MITNKVTTDAMDWLKANYPKYGKVALCEYNMIVIPGGKGFTCLVGPLTASTGVPVEYLASVEYLGGYAAVARNLDEFKSVIKDYDLETQLLDAKGIL